MHKYSGNRSDKLASQIRKDLTDIIRLKLKDPLMPKWFTLTSIELTADNSLAKVYFSALNAEEKNLLTEVLLRSTPFLRSELAKIIHTYTIPQLRFIYDNSLEKAEQIDLLFKKINSSSLEEKTE